MIKLKALVEHTNEYGSKPVKTVGSTYEAPEQAAQALIANKYCEAAATANAKKEG